MLTTRRMLLQASLAAMATYGFPPAVAHSEARLRATRRIPSTGEAIPAVGLGTWITFNVGDDPMLRGECADVMAAFFEAGGGMIDSSPMYGSSQPVVGYGLRRLGRPADVVLGREGLDVLGRRQDRPRSSNPVVSGMCRASTSFRSTISSPGRRICKCCSR